MRIALALSIVSLAACSGQEPEAASEAASVAVPARINVGRYCSVAETEGGQAVVEATVSGEGYDYEMAISSRMPDSDQVLEAGPAKAEVDSDGVLFFHFEDGWGNQGMALLRPDGALRLSVVTPSTDPLGSNIRRNYGDFALTTAACDLIRPIS